MAGIAPATDVGTLSQIVSNAGLTKQTINILTEQSSTGLISTQFEGLGAGARTAINLSVQLAQNSTLQANTDSAANIQQVSQTALGQFKLSSPVSHRSFSRPRRRARRHLRHCLSLQTTA